MRTIALFLTTTCLIVPFASARSVLIIVLDGLRPDYVTADLMPNLSGLAERGVFFEDHHAVFPTVTRVNSPSISTGSYPETHGLMGNSVYFPAVDARRALNTSDVKNLIAIAQAEGGKLLTAPTLPEILGAAGYKAIAVSSGSTGSALLLNPKASGLGMINTELVLPADRAANINADLGPVPAETTPNAARNARAVNAYFRYGLETARADLTLMWLSDPDHTAHEFGPGAPETDAALRAVDEQIGRIVCEHESRGISNDVDIMVTSDHGFSTHTGEANVGALLRREGLDEGVVVAGDSIHVTTKDDATVAKIVKALQEEHWAGAIFTRGASPDANEGHIPGTLSYSLIHYDHPRAPDILVSANWDDKANSHGYKGTTTQGGVAGHGTSGYWDVHNTLIAAGPSFKSGLRSSIPTANVDIAPTALRILGVTPPASMTGRVIQEALGVGPDPTSIAVERGTASATANAYTVTLDYSIVEERRYINFTRVTRANDN